MGSITCEGYSAAVGCLCFPDLMRAEKLEPVSSIDFARSLHVKENSKRISIWMLSASPAGPMVAGGAASLMTSRIARSDRTGSGIVAFELRVPWGGGEAIAPLPDGSFWFVTRSTALAFPNYDLYTREGRYLKSFRIIADSFGGLHPPDSPVNLAASAEEIAFIYTGLIRAGHLAGGDFVLDREWRVNGPHLVFPFGDHNFAAVNRLSGEFAILDPATPDTRTVATPFKSPIDGTVCRSPPRTAASGFLFRALHRICAIWFNSRLMAPLFRATRSTLRKESNRSASPFPAAMFTWRGSPPRCTATNFLSNVRYGRWASPGRSPST
jgi:hypothetical protein